MKSENSLLEELEFPDNYLSAFNDVVAVVQRAHADGVFFRNDFHALLIGNQMALRMDGIQIPLLTADVIVDSRDRMVGDQAVIIETESELKALLRDFDSKNRALYWFLLWKYGADTKVVKTQAGLCLFSILGENGVYDIIRTPAPMFVQDFIQSCECEDCVECAEDFEDDDEDYDDLDDDDLVFELD